MKKQFIKDLKIGSYVESQFVIVDVKERSFSSPAKSGEHFFKLVLGDVTGTLHAVLWDRSIVSDPIEIDDVVYVSGEVKDYQGPQLSINYFKKLDKDKVNRESFQPTSERNIEDMWSSLQNIVEEEVTDRNLRSLWQVFCNDNHLVEKFKHSPAARFVHHNYLGGLLEHSLEVAEISLEISNYYPAESNKSLILLGAIFHDIGKIEEYDLKSFSFKQTNRGHLLGHIIIGLEILRDKINEVPGFPEDLKMKLEHIIISHHGEKEWGAPELPQTFNAFALFHADHLSARLKQFVQVMKKHEHSSSSWTGWDRLLQRKIYYDSPEELT